MPRRGQARLVATLDNLGKGAAGAAVQNLNIMAGFDPDRGADSLTPHTYAAPHGLIFAGL